MALTDKQKRFMQAQLVDIDSIKINPDNPRLIKDEKFRQLVKSIQGFPQMLNLRPIVVNDDMVVLGGNMRLKACIEAGMKEVPILKASDLTPDQQKEFIIKDNVGFGEWAWDTLANEWDTEKLTEWGLDIPDFALQKEAIEDDYEIPDEIETDIVTGDLFEIGQHRLLCGDSTKAEDAAKLMNGQKADMVFTDPPYGVNYGADQELIQKKSGGKLSRSRSRSSIINDNKSAKELGEVLWRPSFKNYYENAKDECSFYMTMCQGGDQMMMMMMMMMSEHWQIKHELIWVKSSPVFSMGRLDYDYQHEPILYGWKKKHNWYGLGQFKKSVWEIPKPTKSTEHPTMKPIALMGNALLNSSKEGNLVIDFFLGSGSTMVAAHQLNRKCYGIEIDPKYCQVIIDRMLKLDPDLEIKKNGKPYIISELTAINA